jgi:hypothetical protein
MESRCQVGKGIIFCSNKEMLQYFLLDFIGAIKNPLFFLAPLSHRAILGMEVREDA